MKCFDLMNDPEQCYEESTLELPSITPSAIMQSASEAVTIKYNEKYGRHLVATRDIEPGEIIIVERGYVAFPLIRLRYLVCSHCLSFAWNGLPCKSCAFAVYCSESCKQNAWKQYHDLECDILRETDLFVAIKGAENIDPVPSLIVGIRLFIIAVKKGGLDSMLKEAISEANQVERLMVDGKIRSDKFRCFINLHTGVTNSKKFIALDIASDIVNMLYKCISKKDENNDATNKPSTDEMKNILGKLTDVINCNGFKYAAEISKCKRLEECRGKCMHCNRGTIVALCSSLMNHSCIPNVRQIFLPKGKVLSYTVAPVKKGEQLFINYGAWYDMETKERQQLLQNNYGFICECELCKENWSSAPQIPLDEIELEKSIRSKIRQEFDKSFPDASKSTIWKDSDEWQYDEETLRHAIKLSELVYKYFDNNKQRALNNHDYCIYIQNAYYALYGEKCFVPYTC